MNLVRLLGILMLLAVALSLGADEATDCIEIEDPAARLACFDRMFPKSKDEKQDDREDQAVAPAVAPAVPSEAVTAGQDTGSSRSAAAGSSAVEQPVATASEVDHSGAVRSSEDDPHPDKGGLFNLDEKIDVSTTISAVHYKPQQKMLFLMENGQVWLQSSPRRLRIREGDRVQISNATVGGYLLRTEDGVTTRVERIR